MIIKFQLFLSAIFMGVFFIFMGYILFWIAVFAGLMISNPANFHTPFLSLCFVLGMLSAHFMNRHLDWGRAGSITGCIVFCLTLTACITFYLCNRQAKSDRSWSEIGWLILLGISSCGLLGSVALIFSGMLAGHIRKKQRLLQQ